MQLLDHLLFIVVALVHPIASYIGFRRLLRRIRAGEPVNRPELYNTTIVGHWTLFGVTMALWAGSGRAFADLGFGLERGDWFAAGVALTIVAMALLILQVRQVRSASDEDVRRFRDSLGNLDFIIPRNGNELGRFYGLSVTAGVVEEVLWRGFLIWYLAHVMPLWVAALVSATWFGIAHLYQGIGNVPRIVLAGIIFAALFLMTGSLWIPIVMHAAVDILQGRLGYEVMTRGQDGEPPADAEVSEDAAT